MNQLRNLFVPMVFISLFSFGGNPKIILKLDDYKIKNNTCKGIQVLAYLKEKKVKAAFGIIASGCDTTSKSVLSSYLNATNKRGEKIFEAWNHGFDHVKPEFKETSFEYQKKHFLMADSIIVANLGVLPHTFGAPYNSNDTNTLKVIQLIPRYKVLYFSQIKPMSASGIVNLSNRINFEVSTGVPDSVGFVANYHAAKNKFTDYIVLQAHPPYFTNSSFEQFKKQIEFLLNEGCEFVLPFEYYCSKNM